MTWADYYDRFYDWAESTQVRYLSSLSTLGPADEVGEIIIELQVNVPAANRLLRKAVEAKLAFSGSDLVEFACINDKELATAAVRNSAERSLLMNIASYEPRISRLQLYKKPESNMTQTRIQVGTLIFGKWYGPMGA